MDRAYTSLPYVEHVVANGRFDISRVKIDRIVLHTIVGTMQSAINLFASPPAPGKETSAHYGVRYDGGLVAWLEEYYTAYANGNYNYNQRSVTIEHEDMGNYNSPRPEALKQSSARLVADLCKYYGIPCDRQHILKHNEVPGSSTACPSTLEVDEIVERAKQILAGDTPAPSPIGENVKRKSSFFDKWWMAYYGTDIDTDKVTEKQAEDRRKWSLQERDRAGIDDKTVLYLYAFKLKGPDGKLIIPTEDSNKISFTQIRTAIEMLRTGGVDLVQIKKDSYNQGLVDASKVSGESIAKLKQ